MKRYKWMLLLPFFLLSQWAVAQTQSGMLPVPENLQQEAAQAQAAGKPLVLLFSLPDCPFCKVVRQNYLMPMLRDPAVAERPVIRELQITSRKSVTGFDGMLTTQAALAKRYGVRMAPTLVFVDAAGEQIAAPVVGGDGHGFYIAYLDKAFDEAAKNLASGGQKK